MKASPIGGRALDSKIFSGVVPSAVDYQVVSKFKLCSNRNSILKSIFLFVQMEILQQVTAALKQTYSSINENDLDERIEQVVKENSEICDYLIRVLADSPDEQIERICPVLVDRKQQLSWIVRTFESPVVSCGWLVLTNKRVLYVGVLSRPTMNAWGGVARVNTVLDNSSYSFDAIDSLEFEERDGKAHFRILAEEGERFVSEVEPKFAGTLKRMSNVMRGHITK